MTQKQVKIIDRIYKDFNLDDAAEIKAIEKTTNHDVKAVEYFLKKKFNNLGLAPWQEWIHFACTSADINNTSYGEAGISWKNTGSKFFMDIKVPVGCTATVYVPSEGLDNIHLQMNVHL